MKRNLIETIVLLAGALLMTVPTRATQWIVAPDGAPTGQGTKSSPWDILSALNGSHKVAPGDTVWLQAGTYKYPFGIKGAGYEVRLAGTKEAPIQIRGVSGKRVTIVRVFYGPGGFTRAHRHAGSVTAYVTKGEIRSQLGGGPVETFKPGQSFFEPPGDTHLVSANASNTEPAELIAVFVADEGAQLTTFIE